MKHTTLAHKLFCDLTIILTDNYLTYPIFLAHAAPFMRASARELALSGKSVCAFLSAADFIFKIRLGLKAPAESSCRLPDPPSQEFIFSNAFSVEIFHKYFYIKSSLRLKTIGGT